MHSLIFAFDKFIQKIYYYIMKNGRGKTDALGALAILLILPTIVYYKEILIICLIILLVKLIRKIKKRVLIRKQEKLRGYWRNNYIDYVSDKNEYEEYLNDKKFQKGNQAEEKIVKILERIFKKENIIHDAYFRDDEFVTTQVDIMAIDNTGIYVIESKAFSSIIKGKSNEKMWVQLFGGKKYNRFHNPINQNKRHLEAVKNNLKEFTIPEECFKSYIVFGNNCKLDVSIDENCKAKVIQQKDLLYSILAERKHTENILTEELVNKISIRFRAHSNIDDKMKMEHIKRRQNNVKYVVQKR